MKTHVFGTKFDPVENPCMDIVSNETEDRGQHMAFRCQEATRGFSEKSLDTWILREKP